MTHVDDLYEQGDDREPAEPAQEPPLDLDAIEDSIRTYYAGSDDDSAKAAEDLATVMSSLVAELREARQRIAEFEALPTRENWTVTPRRDVTPAQLDPLMRRPGSGDGGEERLAVVAPAVLGPPVGADRRQVPVLILPPPPRHSSGVEVAADTRQTSNQERRRSK
ncbi:hypothetical protein ACGFNP_25620 [Nonomuraea sp. NPDC049269]|uniref:hypothetical protein n=1 Tax=Nonomuraea sp. NPDC049269 TaxID=3364349 RepID=UPI00371C901F